MAERLKISKDLDTPLYWRIINEQEAGVTPKRSRLLKDLSRVFVLGGGITGAMLMSTACVPFQRETVEVREASPSATPFTITPTETFTPTPTFTATPTETLTPTPTETPTLTPAPAETPTPTSTPTETLTPTPKPTETATLTPRPSPTPTETKTPEPTPVPYKVAFKNIFNWPGWARPQGVEISGNGSTLELLSDPDSLWLLLANENESSWLTVKGDFEIQFKGVLGEETAAGNKTGRIKFYNRSSLSQKEYDTLQMGIKKDSQLVLEVINSKAGRLESLGAGKIPASGNLRIRFTNVDKGEGETITIFNGDTNEEIIKNKLSFQFFQKETKLSFGFEVGNGVKFLTMADFKILVPQGTQNVSR